MASTTFGCAWPMLRTEIPEEKSIRRFPSTSSTTEPDARRITIGADLVVVATNARSRSTISRAFGPGGVTLMSGNFTQALDAWHARGPYYKTLRTEPLSV